MSSGRLKSMHGGCRCIFVVVLVMAIGSSASAQTETTSDGGKLGDNLVYRAFDIEGADLRVLLGLESAAAYPDPFAAPAPPSKPMVDQGNLDPLFLHAWPICDHSRDFREAGIDLPDGSAFVGAAMPFLFVRAPPEIMVEIEQALAHEAPAFRFDNLWCRAIVVAGDTAAAGDRPEEILKQGTVLSDLEVFSSDSSEIRLGSLAEDADDADAWGSSLGLHVDGITVEVSLHCPEMDGDGPLGLDWSGYFEKSAIGTTRVVPVTFTGKGQTKGVLLIRLEPLPAFGLTVPAAELLRQKEELWQELGPDFEARPAEERYPEKSGAEWARTVSRSHFFDEATNTVYFETFGPRSFLTFAPGSAGPSGEVSAAGFRDVFGTGKVYNVRPLLEAYGAVFRPNDVAVYSISNLTLFARAEPDQIALIEAIIQPLHSGYSEKMIRFRVATFEATGKPAPSFERIAVSALEPVRIPDSRSLVARSGQRARITAAGTSHPFELEIDPVLGPDDLTMDLHVTYSQPGDVSTNLQVYLTRGQTAAIPIGPPPYGRGARRILAIRPELVGSWGSLLELGPATDYTDPGPKPASTPWEKRGAKFKLIPTGPAPKPGKPHYPSTAAPDPFAAP